MSEGEIPALKEALFAQQQLLQKLYSELDEEREASSTAASEALSMILRLQGEKAAVKMEANQYKRLAEEKICHAEEALAIFEDLIYQKEMEIASLEYQVQAYKYRLLSLGCSDIGVCETKFPENLLQRNEFFSGETSSNSQNQASLRRNSTPLLPYKFSLPKKGSIEIERSISPDSVEKVVEDMKSVDVERSADSSAHGGDINSYWEQIRRLDERVKEIADAKGIKAISSLRSGRSSALVSPPSTEFFPENLSNEVAVIKSREAEDPESLSEKEANIGVCSSNVYDVFEVPQSSEGSEKLGIPESLLPPKYQKKVLPGAEECQMGNLNNSTICFYNSKFLRQYNRAPEIIEAEREVARPEITIRGEEEIKLLKEIQEQLNSIQCDIRSLKPRMTGEALDYSMVHLSEAMLHFWL